jgi:hypothetical protein
MFQFPFTIRDIMQYYNSVIKPLKSHVQCENTGNDMHVTFVGFFCIKQYLQFCVLTYSICMT